MPAYYRSSLESFHEDDPSTILGQLAAASAKSGFVDLKKRQIKTWQKHVTALRAGTKSLIKQIPESKRWGVLLENPIPRRQKRIHAVFLAGDVIFCLEFKTENKRSSEEVERQVEDYALDLRDFHHASRGHVIVPIVVSVKGGPQKKTSVETTDLVRSAIHVRKSNLGKVIAETFRAETKQETSIKTEAWDNSPYRPVPTLLEATRALCEGRNLRDLIHSPTGAKNLSITSDRLAEIVREAESKKEKVACFITGVPGSGKSLAGLNLLLNPTLRRQQEFRPVFVSPNCSVVKALSVGIHRNGADSEDEIVIENLHQFLRNQIKESKPWPNVLIIDDGHHLEADGKSPNLSAVEAVFSALNRAEWAVVVVLAGQPRETLDNKVGLSGWGDALRMKFPNWYLVLSPAASEDARSGDSLFPNGDTGNLSFHTEPAFHLDLALRPFRAQRVVEWVDAILDFKPQLAAKIMEELKDFPLVLTRSLETARTWLRRQTRGLRRCGLVASSGALRLRADGIEISPTFRQGNRELYLDWFLKEPPDIRSSNQLEIAATECECRGLELDWTGLCWGGDVVADEKSERWLFREFDGRDWETLKDSSDQAELLGKYRTLLSRAREGTVIWIPEGSEFDRTRSREDFEHTAAYLASCGVQTL